jgi:hypothetical protein
MGLWEIREATAQRKPIACARFVRRGTPSHFAGMDSGHAALAEQGFDEVRTDALTGGHEYSKSISIAIQRGPCG